MNLHHNSFSKTSSNSFPSKRHQTQSFRVENVIFGDFCKFMVFCCRVVRLCFVRSPIKNRNFARGWFHSKDNEIHLQKKNYREILRDTAAQQNKVFRESSVLGVFSSSKKYFSIKRPTKKYNYKKLSTFLDNCDLDLGRY